MGVCVPEEYGGAGADFVSYILVLEELSRGDAGVGVTVAVHTSAATLPILPSEPTSRSARFVPPLARGEHLGAFALTEPEAGSDARLAAHEGRGRRRRLADHRAKQWITNGTLRGHVPPLRPHRPGDAGRARRLGVPARRRAGARDARRGEARPQLVGRPSTSSSRACRSGATACCTRRARASRSRWRRSTAAASGSPRRRSGSRRQRSTSAREYAKERRTFGKRDRGAPGDPVQARRHGDRDRRGAAARLPRGVAEGQGRPAHRGGREGEAVRVRDGAAPDRRGDPDPRRLRLHEGVPGRALLPRREDHRDLRGHERDPAARDRPLDPRAPPARAHAGG